MSVITPRACARGKAIGLSASLVPRPGDETSQSPDPSPFFWGGVWGRDYLSACRCCRRRRHENRQISSSAYCKHNQSVASNPGSLSGEGKVSLGSRLNQSVDIGEKLIYTGFELLKQGVVTYIPAPATGIKVRSSGQAIILETIKRSRRSLALLKSRSRWVLSLTPPTPPPTPGWQSTVKALLAV